jgi:multidrug resistance efflux pump
VGFTEGQLVKKGDFLAQIDPRPYEYLKEQYEGQLRAFSLLLPLLKREERNPPAYGMSLLAVATKGGEARRS